MRWLLVIVSTMTLLQAEPVLTPDFEWIDSPTGEAFLTPSDTYVGTPDMYVAPDGETYLPDYGSDNDSDGDSDDY